MYVGDSDESKGWKFYCPKRRMVILSRDATFQDGVPFYARPSSDNLKMLIIADEPLENGTVTDGDDDDNWESDSESDVDVDAADGIPDDDDVVEVPTEPQVGLAVRRSGVAGTSRKRQRKVRTTTRRVSKRLRGIPAPQLALMMSEATEAATRQWCLTLCQGRTRRP